MFETNRYRTDDLFVNEIIEQNLKSTVPIAFMTNNADALADFQEDNRGRAVLNLDWEPELTTSLDQTNLERYKAANINLSAFFGVEMDALEYAAVTSEYDITIPIFTTGFEGTAAINAEIINNTDKISILRADKVYGIVIPRNLATWFFDQYRIEQAALMASFLESTTIETAVAFSQAHPGINTGDFTFRRIARKYQNVEMIQFDCKQTQVLAFFAKRLQDSRIVRVKRISFRPFIIPLVIIILVIAYLLTRRENMFRLRG